MAETVAIVDYGSGNLRSAAKAFERAAAESGRSATILVTDKPDAVAAADRIVLPGVGAFADCKAGLAAIDGMIEALETAAIRQAKPFLGICVGMQLMATTGTEHGAHAGLGWIAGSVVPLAPGDRRLKVPHMGWNTLASAEAAHPLLAPADGGDAYFVHSYHFVPEDRERVIATVDYGGPVIAAVGRDTLIGTQFHPEKSQAVGLDLIARFLAWRP